MAVIHVLDKHTAELIAAGEVVERPASVVKELLENSIDAGATQVTVSIESGGVKLIEISDNGTGIEAEYISTAFIRHATSKIETPDDLTNIHTLGFRGEALASIASVARVELTTRTEVDEFATVYRIEGGEEVSREPGARAVGTTIRVKDLLLQHACPHEVPQKGLLRGHLCVGYSYPCSAQPPRSQRQVHPRGQAAVCHARRRPAARCSLCGAGPGVQPGPH